MAQTQRTTEMAGAGTVESAAVSAEKDTEQPREAHEPIYGPVEDELFGKRIRRSFGSRAFWGSVVDAYVVGKGLFYKVSFDDGDVDILSVDEVKLDVEAAKSRAAEDLAVAKEPEAEDMESPEKTDSYADLLRSRKASLKRRRDGASSDSANDQPQSSLAPWDVKLWSTRLFATIMEENGYIRVQALLPMADGGKGELESSGTIQPGDAVLAIQGRVVHGVMDHNKACDLIRSLPRPLTLTFIRPPSSGERLTLAVAQSMTKEKTSGEVQERNEDDKDGESAAKKTRTDEVSKTAATPEPPLAASAVSSPETLTNPPSRNSRPPTPEFEIVQVVQPAAPWVPQPQQHQHRPSPYFARGPSRSEVTSHVNTADDQRKRSFAVRSHHPSEQIEPIPFRQPSPAQRQPSPHPPGVVQMPHPQGGQRGYALLSSYSGQNNTVHHNSAHYNSRGQQTPVAYTSASMVQMAHAPPTSTRTTFYVSQPAPSNHYAQQGTPGPNPNYRVMSSGNHTYVVNGGHQNTQQMRGGSVNASSSYQPSRANPSVMQAPPPQRSEFDFRERAVQSSRGGAAPFYPQNAAGYSVPHGAITTQDPPQLPKQTIQRPMPSQPSANATQTMVERQEKPPASAQATPSMTLGDLVANLHQRERQRVARRLAGHTSHPQASGVQLTTSAVTSNGARGGSRAPSPNAHHSVSSAKSPSPAPSVDDEPSHSFLSIDDDDDEFASTGTSFLSVDDTSPTSATPTIQKSNAAASYTDGNPTGRKKPNYLSKYASDEVIEVQIKMARLYLTLGVMGDHVSVSTFVRGQAGEIGEIEASGRVLTGDMLIGVGSYECTPETTPTDVARVVSLMPRPYYAYFMRPSWDMLE